jgi:hypothetical protein
MLGVPEGGCWLHPDVVVRSSPIEGLGLFARAPIGSATIVSRLGGRLVSGRELAALFASAESYVDTITVAADRHLVLPLGTPNGRGNHGCDPNVWWVGPYELAARRDISVGEELTNDYATSTADPAFTMPCSCGSRLCRQIVTGADWRRPELQARYGTHWVAPLRALIAAANQ